MKITYQMNLPLAGLTESQKKKAKDEAGKFLIDAILDKTGSQQSSVMGQGRFKKLNKDYARSKAKEATPIANLELSGDMLDALEVRPKPRGIEVGIFKESEALKADNHNKFSAKSKKTNVPARKFIPNKKSGESFRRDIKKEIARILQEFKDDPLDVIEDRLNGIN